METYLLKSSLSLILLYGLYRVLVRYEFNHQLNRFIGLVCIVFSVGFPFVQFRDLPQAGQLPGAFYAVARGTAGFQETVSSAMAGNDTISVILLLYAIGAGVFLLRCVAGLATLLGFYVNSTKSYQWGFTVVTLNKNMSPFTFFNVLFIGRDQPEDTDMETVLLHEWVHRDQYHSIDLLLLEMLTVVFWFNPVVWFFKKDIKAEHEYFADKRVLENGIDLADYQYTLFRAQTGTSIEAGNYLSDKTSLTKRFNMMTKIKSNSKGSYVRASLFLALMSVILLLGAFSGRHERSQIDKKPVYKEGEEAMIQQIAKRIVYPASARRENRTGSVRVSFTVNESGYVENIKEETGEGGYLFPELVITGYSLSSQKAKGVDNVLKAEAISVVAGLGEFIPAQKDGKPVSAVVTLPITFTLAK